MARNKHNTPGIIKHPFWRMTYQYPEDFYACVNLGGGLGAAGGYNRTENSVRLQKSFV